MSEYLNLQNYSTSRLLARTLDDSMLNDSFSSKSLEIDNDFFQHEIYYEVRRNNAKIEVWHHFFGVFGTLFALFGILGNLMSIIILLKPTESSLSRKRSSGLYHPRRSLASIDYRLISFYSYLTALSFCDLFSCIFAILNVLEYLLPTYMEMNSLRYHELCQSLRIYTHPIATTLQALSCWLICAFSIHRCKSIAKLTDCFGCLKWAVTLRHRNIFQSMWSKARASLGGRSVAKDPDSVSTYSGRQEKLEKKSIYEMTVNDMPTKSRSQTSRCCRLKKFTKITRARLIIIFLYVSSVAYLVPQWFEKRLTYIEIQNRVYVFTTITEFGQSKLYRQVFHLWFYMLAIYIIPFLLILLFNLILLRTFVNSKKKCSQYKLKSHASVIIKDMNSTAVPLETNKTIEIMPNLCTGVSISPVDQLKQLKTTQQRRVSITPSSPKLLNKSRALTLTLFGVVAIFFVCHLPAAVAKIIYVLYPKVEFESVFASFFLDLSNFLIMFNSSINFLLYVVFGPGRFRQEFSYIFFTVFKCFRRKEAIEESDSFSEHQRRLSVPGQYLYPNGGLSSRSVTASTKFMTIVEDEEDRRGAAKYSSMSGTLSENNIIKG